MIKCQRCIHIKIFKIINYILCNWPLLNKGNLLIIWRTASLRANPANARLANPRIASTSVIGVLIVIKVSKTYS